MRSARDLVLAMIGILGKGLVDTVVVVRPKGFAVRVRKASHLLVTGTEPLTSVCLLVCCFSV
jgi:hypothetical protein